MEQRAHEREASACGKVILLGEHSVVYGRPALAAGLARGSEARFTAALDEGAPEGSLSLHVAPWSAVFRAGDDSDLGRALEALREVLPARCARAGTLRATLHLPGGGGLGSSASLGVAVARALAPEARALDDDEALAAGLAWETVFHGNPSGIDHTMATRGGAGMYTKGRGLELLHFHRPLHLVIADTGERSPTKDMVASVARQHERKPAATEKTFDAIASLVRNAAMALEAGDTRALGQLMDMNQALLSSLLLSTERTEALCRAAREAGARGAKLTGGGGGGCMIALCEGDEDSRIVRAALEREGAPVWEARIAPSCASGHGHGHEAPTHSH